MDDGVTRKRPPEDVCPGEVNTEVTSQTTYTPMAGAVAMETSGDELGRLDIDLDRKSKQLNLTSKNVRAILHEVITHERVVAMMKTAITDTLDLPMFEPKLTRSRLKQTIHQPPQFLDIDLEEDDDSSDEEYCPDDDDEEEEEEEEAFFSDVDSLTSPPRMHQLKDQRNHEALQTGAGNLRESVRSSSAPEKVSFLERLDAVEAELQYPPPYNYEQPMGRNDNDEGDGGDGDEGCLAYRTRSKRPLVDVPLGQLEAELLAPDITADMYEDGGVGRQKDPHWTEWLQSLMAPDCGDEVEDDDDPEYDFVQDLGEPDREDYRTDRAVQITKKEVNKLLEELFETLQEEEEEEQQQEEEEEEEEQEEDQQQEEEEEEQEEEQQEEQEEEEQEVLSQTGPKFNIPQALRFEALFADMLTQRRHTVRKQYKALQQRKALQDTTNHLHDNKNATLALTSVLGPVGPVSPVLHLNHAHKQQLQQQIQQHVQLLTEVHLLSRRVDTLQDQAKTTKQYLEELKQFASRQEEVCRPTAFRVCNLQGALTLLQEVEQREEPSPSSAATPATSRSRWLPSMSPVTNSLAFPLLPADSAWLFATRHVFLYPELLPICSLDPALHSRAFRRIYTAGEEGLMALALKHFEGTPQADQLICSYLICENRWSFRKRVREMSSSRAAPDNPVKMFLTQRVVPPLPRACFTVQCDDQRPPVDRSTSNIPIWLKNSQQIIQKTRLVDASYPAHLPPDVTLRLHPYWLKRAARPRPRPHRRLFTLAHNGSLLPLAKAPPDAHGDVQPISSQAPPSSDNRNVSDWSAEAQVLAPPLSCSAIPPPAVQPDPSHPPLSCLPIGQNIQQGLLTGEVPAPLLLPLCTSSSFTTTSPIMPCSAAVVKPGYFLLQMVWPPVFPATSQQAVGPHLLTPQEEERGKEGKNRMEEGGGGQEKMGGVREGEETERGGARRNGGEEKGNTEGNGGEKNGGTGRGGETQRGGAGGSGEEDKGDIGGGGETERGGAGRGEKDKSTEGGKEEKGGTGGGGGEDSQRRGGGEEREEEEKDEEQDRPGEEEDEEEEDEEEEDFDDLTQDEDEEEVMSSASEESVLSVPELQETMKQLTWLAAERRLCGDGDSEEDHSPTSQEEEDEEDEVQKEEELLEGRSPKAGLDEEVLSGEGTPRGRRKCPGRGRGRNRPLGGLRRTRQERHSKDATKLLLLLDENIVENDPHRESKDAAFAQSYLNRVREALQDVPAQVEEFVSLLDQFEKVGDGQEVIPLFRKLRGILGNRTDLLRDFAAFLHPAQALHCGLWEEQQAFERSRRFLRQLEISFGENPCHYQKIIKALQTGPNLSPGAIHELKAQMELLLKGHTHLQAEFWVFFDELRPPAARPGQFEEAHWPEEGGGGSDCGESVSQVSGGGARGDFEEVTLPELEEEEDGLKHRPMTSRRQKRKVCDWSDKDWPCLCHDVKMRHRRKGCPRCHGNKTPGGVSRAMKSLDPLYTQIGSAHDDMGDKDLELKGGEDSPPADRRSASWEGLLPLTNDKDEEEAEEEEEGELKSSENEEQPVMKRRREQVPGVSASDSSSSAAPRPAPPPPPLDLPVCAKNISLTASGEKVILWTREADRVILTTCQQEGANQNTFQAVSSLLGNKTPSEVSRRFHDLMRLFRTAARHAGSEDEAPPCEDATDQ